MKAFVDRVNESIQAAHADGRMKELSKRWFETDYTTPAGEFDISVLRQEVE
ncbi:MAG: hypothetical protein ABIP77_08980 [Candidatus Limnocylindrales bacterium]